ncbi:helix-turn-helix domain-containing protein [Ornithinimicrobium cavernae]|uniref:helix-turn-helix domain-containing protein n=1 Tax=Ornithinimicrobium cavernae TaxID=2666047 RepID=UPI003B02E62C
MLGAGATPIGDPRCLPAGPTRDGRSDIPASSGGNDQQGQVLTLFAAGLTAKAVARQLGVTERTVQCNGGSSR